MKNSRLLVLAIVAALAAAALIPSGAGAEPLYRYDAHLHATVYAYNLNPLLNTTVRLMRGATEIARNDFIVGNSYAYVSDSSLQAGDVVQVYQSASNPAAANPPVTSPTETFTVPALTISATAGNPVISGTAEPDDAVHVYVSPYCESASDSMLAVNSAGAFSVKFPSAMLAREVTSATAVQPDGDSVTAQFSVPGDAGCFYANANLTQYGTSNDPTPYSIGEDGMDFTAIPTVRVVLRRGGTIIADVNGSNADLTAAQKPLAGDVVEIYRPQTAPTPVRTYTIPAVSAVFDPGNDMVAVNAPAGLQVQALACRAFDCAGYNWRAARDVPAGRTIFSFAQPFGVNRAIDLRADDQISANWKSAGALMNVTVSATPGDLTSPIGKITLAKKLKLKKIGKKIKFKLNSSEAGSAVSALTTSPVKGKSKKPITLASARTAVKSGTNTISLKVSGKGKKTIKQIIASRKSRTATLQVSLTDAAGNVTTVVKSTKLALK